MVSVRFFLHLDNMKNSRTEVDLDVDVDVETVEKDTSADPEVIPEGDPKVVAGKKQYVCDVCNNKYKQHSSFYRHRKICGKDVADQFVCDICDKSFTRKDTLQRHKPVCIKRHRVFKCQNCGSTFKKNWMLQRHLKNVDCSQTKEHHCRNCDQIFKTKSALRNHQRKHRIAAEIVHGIGAHNVPDVFAGDVIPYPVAPDEPQDDADPSLLFMDAESEDEDGVSYTTVVGPAASSFLTSFNESIPEPSHEFDSHLLEEQEVPNGKIWFYLF